MSEAVEQLQRTRRWYQSIYLRFILYFSLVLLGISILQHFAITKLYTQLSLDITQRLHWDLAERLKQKVQPLLAPRLDREAVLEQFYYLQAYNPGVEAYVLDSEGRVVLSTRTFQRRFYEVEIAQLKKASAADALPDLPLYASNPLRAGEQVPFSAAEIRLEHERGYLYIVFQSDLSEFLRRAQGQYYLLVYGLFNAVATLLLGASVSIALFYLLSANFRKIITQLRNVQRGDFSTRMPVRGNDEVAEIASTINAMTERIEESLDALRKSDERRRELVSHVSHDLRSPLTALGGFIEAAKRRADEVGDSRLIEYLAHCTHSLYRQQSLVEDLFALSKLEAKDRAPAFEGFSLLELVHDALTEKKAEADARDISIRLIADDSLPAVYADISMIDRVVSNLIENAVRYTPEGGEVCVSLDADETQVNCKIENSGSGIAEEHLERIFEPFYRVDADRNPNTGGTGLGLAIVRRILQAHDAEIFARSASGAGVEFHFSLPREHLG